MANAPARWDLEVGWISVGSGLGGTCSAIAAHDAGGEAVILEKAPKLGGLSGYGAGEVFVPNNRWMRELGIEDNDEDGRAYLGFVAGGFNRPEHFEKLYATTAEAVDYFGRAAGVPWLAVEGLPDYYYPKAVGSHAGGRYLSVELFDAKQLGDWQFKTYAMSPHIPPAALHREMYAWGGLSSITQWDYELIGKRLEEDQRSMGAGMMGWLLKAAVVDRGISAWVETPVRELVTDDAGALFVGRVGA